METNYPFLIVSKDNKANIKFIISDNKKDTLKTIKSLFKNDAAVVDYFNPNDWTDIICFYWFIEKSFNKKIQFIETEKGFNLEIIE